MKKYKVQFNNEIYGPYEESELKALVAREYFPNFAKYKVIGEVTWKTFEQSDFGHNTEETIHKNFTLINKIQNLFEIKEEKLPLEKVLPLKKNKEISTAPKEGKHNLDKTLLTKTTFDYLEGKKKEVEQNLKGVDGKTNILNIKELKEVINEANVLETSLESKVVNKRNDLKNTKIHKSQNIEQPDAKKKRGLYALVILGVIYFLLIDDPKVQTSVQFIRPDYSMPIGEQKLDEGLANSLIDEGDQITQESYSSLIKRAQFYKLAAQKGGGQKALKKLLLTYVLLLEYESSKNDLIKVYRMISLLKNKESLEDLEVVQIRSLFFHHAKKYSANISYVENFLELNKKINPLILASYLNSLLQVGDLEKSNQVMKKLLESENLNLTGYLAMLGFLDLENKYESFGKVFAEAYSKYPTSNLLLLQGAKYFLLAKKFDDLEEILKRIENQNFEFNRNFYAKYIELQGSFLALNKKYDLAMKYFEKAIKLNPNSEIMAKLSSLKNNAEYSEFDQLIRKSQALNFTQNAKESFDQKNFEKASTEILKAIDYFPDYIPPRILLAKIQIAQGYLGDAIKGLLESKSSLTYGDTLNLVLLEAYIESYKFKEASALMSNLSQGEMKSDDVYASLVSDFYRNQGDLLRSVLWLQNAIKFNPLNEDALEKLAQIYLENNKLTKAKRILLRGIELNPSRVSFKILYSKVIFELEGSEVALGYLRGLAEKSPNESELNNNLAIMYYRSGSIDSYDELIKKIKNADQSPKQVYKFLMEVAANEDKVEDYIKNAEQYLILNPSDNKTRLNLAKFYLERGKLEESESVLIDIKERIEGFPKLHSMLSEIALKQGNFDSAISLAKKEITLNPYSSYGYIQKGHVLMAQKDYSKAEADFKKAQRLDSQNPDLIRGLAEVKMHRNQLEASLELFKKAIDLSETIEPDIYYQIGVLYQRLGRPKMASESYKTYLDLYPDAPNKVTILEYIRTLSE